MDVRRANVLALVGDLAAGDGDAVGRYLQGNPVHLGLQRLLADRQADAAEGEDMLVACI